MKTSFGTDLQTYDTEHKIIDKTAYYLNKGQLSLLLGAGISIRELEFPSWKVLVKKCFATKFPKETFDDNISNNDLKDIAQKIKDECNEHNNEYLTLITEKLYEGIELDFKLAKRDILIALTSLMVGKVRGNVHNIITYNFDCVLEWFLEINGLKVNIVTDNPLQASPSDVNVVHLHGFLPHSSTSYTPSDNVVFTKEEFDERMISKSNFKDIMYSIFKSNVFLSIGVGVDTLISDVIPYLQGLDRDFYQDDLRRKHPFGIAFVDNIDEPKKNKLLANGIIPLHVSREDLTDTVFKVAQQASTVNT